MSDEMGEMTAYAGDRAVVWYENCLNALALLPDNYADSIVTDPPYGLGFMGKDWDGLPPGEDWARGCLRVLKPGGYLLAFGGSRTWHRLAVAVEDAGFEIRDSIAWLYGSGFPKSLDVSKAIDKQRDDNPERQVVGAWLRTQREEAGLKQKEVAAHWPSVTGGLTGCVANWELGLNCPTWEQWLKLRDLIGFGDEMDAEVWRLNGRKGTPGNERPDRVVVAAGSNGIYQPKLGVRASGTPVLEDAQRWQGWGTALKPAFEPIVVGRKPFPGTVAGNVLEHGTGALNIDGCRIAGDDAPDVRPASPAGRWPTNVVLDESQAAELDKQTGILKSGDLKPYVSTNGRSGGIMGDEVERENTYTKAGDSGGASRFFPVFRYQAKASAKERPKDADGKGHPTVKPLEFMRWLVRLVTPPGGLVLDTFAGSGTTGEAALLEGFTCLLIEKEADYLPLIQQRLERVPRGETAA